MRIQETVENENTNMPSCMLFEREHKLCRVFHEQKQAKILRLTSLGSFSDGARTMTNY